MKNIITYVVLALMIMAAYGCNDAEYGAAGTMDDKLGVHAYLVESNSTPGIANSVVTLGSTVTNLVLTPSLTDKEKSDAEFRLVIDKDVLERFNEAEGTGYVVLPEDLVKIESNVKIAAGKFSQDPFIISVKPLPSKLIGTPFALPLRMEKVSGNAEVTSRTASYVYVISSQIIDDLPMFVGASGLRTDDAFNLPQFTIEMRLQVSNTSNRNRDLFFCNTDNGAFMARFEDPQSDQDGIKAHALAQFQGIGDYLNPTIPLEPNKWQHYAVTFDGTNVAIYVNGSFAGKKEIKNSVINNGQFPYMSFMGVGGNYGYWSPGDRWWYGCKVMTNEIRVWDVARTADQIANNIKSVSPDSKGLIGYWRLGRSNYDTSKKIFMNLAGDHHHLHTDKNFTWVANVSSEDYATPW
ncbi:MAG: DUF1735 and LamG domain-containing protein [Bacteroidales bacterium]|nr:DUF1735 and LamG domain-containing protein [Bacteroidales bacterium]MDY6001432.1 DUF1735 and LamG domain-containing protein [Candidatus Cryptobacteroides sp.]